MAITARDPAENSSYVSLKVILDTQPPQINVTYPAEGEAVNTPTLSISGYIIDQYVNEVTVSVNDGQPQALTLTGTNFGGAVNLNPGQNRLTFNALDKAGNTATLTRSVLLDVTAPAVTITAPQTGVVFSGTIAVTAEASDVASGIASLTLYVDGQAQGILNQPPFNFKLDTSTIASGLHTITVRATDSAGNQAEASVSVTVDNTSPVVAITSPVSGAFVSGFITLSVQASDAISGIASVSLYVDGQLQTTRNQPPFDFSLNSLLFSSGSHTITARGIDTAGNQAETTITISFDHVAPAVSITSPAPGTVVSGVITVTVEASDSISEVANVTLYVDNQPRSTLDAPPFSFTVDTSGLAPDSHTLTARAIDRAGNQAEASISITVTESIRIEITSPLNGATINKSSTLVQGRLHNQTGEVGVTVNGLLAEAQGSDFAAILPLQVGQNTLTATATGPDGVQSQASITINTETQQEFVRLTTMPPSGILDQTGILNVTFEAEAYLLNPVSNYSWDFDGDGIPEITGTEATVIAQYQYPGLFFPRVAVTDTQGNIYTETTIVNVLSREEVDALLRSKWEGMRSRLLSGDIEGALVFLNEPKKEAYKKLLNALAPWLPAIVQEMSDIQLIEYIDNAVIYDLRTLRRGEEFSFQLLFEKDGNGVWKITSF